jgi:hypothetical protein
MNSMIRGATGQDSFLDRLPIEPYSFYCIMINVSGELPGKKQGRCQVGCKSSGDDRSSGDQFLERNWSLLMMLAVTNGSRRQGPLS